MYLDSSVGVPAKSLQTFVTGMKGRSEAERTGTGTELPDGPGLGDSRVE